MTFPNHSSSQEQTAPTKVQYVSRQMAWRNVDSAVPAIDRNGIARTMLMASAGQLARTVLLGRVCFAERLEPLLRIAAGLECLAAVEASITPNATDEDQGKPSPDQIEENLDV